MTRPKVIAGNWKMHNGPSATQGFFRDFEPEMPDAAVVLIVFPPALSFAAAVQSRRGRPEVELGVQNVFWEPKGAFTGEVSAAMAMAAGATYVLVGHSERRHVFGETDSEVTQKVQAVVKEGLVPVACVGETLAEREAGRVEEVILRQLDAILDGVDCLPGCRFMVAYEPVWAIGTGETATSDDARAAHAVLRSRLEAHLGIAEADKVPILYGGSVKPGNAGNLLATPGVDGVLVGGASLDAESFSQIVESV